MAKAQLAAGLPRHRITNSLLAQSQDWDSVSISQLRWQIAVAKQLGSSLVPVLQQLIEQDRLVTKTKMFVEQALQVPRLTSKLVVFTPWLCLVIAQAMGLSPLRFLIFQPIGWSILFICVLLQMGANLMAKRTLLPFNRPTFADPGAALEAVAFALESGIGFRRACLVVAEHSGEKVDRFIDLKAVGGLGLNHILRARAQQLRDQQSQTLQLGLERLGVKLLVPLAAFLLPQFMLLTVLPIAASSVMF
jgi:hypothetical protein